MLRHALLSSSLFLAGILCAQCDGTETPQPGIPAVGGAVSNPVPGTSTGGGTGGTGGTTVTEGDAGASMTGVNALVTALNRALLANEASYGQVDLEDLDDLLTYSLLRAQSPGGRGAASFSCVHNALIGGMSAAQATALCPDVLEDSSTCASQALIGGFDRDSAVSLCSFRGSTATADCANATLRLIGSSLRSQAVVACTDRDGETTATCVQGAQDAGFSHSQAVSLCKHRGSSLTVGCATTAISSDVALSRDDAVTLCADRGAKETASCAATALRGGFSHAQAVRLCSGRGEDSNAVCAIDATTTSLTRDQAVEVCRRHYSQSAASVQGDVQGIVPP